jgi:hypothetical protein
MTEFVIAAVLAVGYTLGRARLGHRASQWANRRQYDQTIRRHSACWWARWLVLSTENIGWLIAHPVQGWHAWQHRNDPPPPRSPAPQFDPDWVEKRRARLAAEEPTS